MVFDIEVRYANISLLPTIGPVPEIQHKVTDNLLDILSFIDIGFQICCLTKYDERRGNLILVYCQIIVMPRSIRFSSGFPIMVNGFRGCRC